MSNYDALAFIALAAAVSVIFGLAFDAYKRRLAFKERQLELMAESTAEKAAQYAAQAQRLEDRVQVLERIATDKGADLAARIEDLRDPRVN